MSLMREMFGMFCSIPIMYFYYVLLWGPVPSRMPLGIVFLTCTRSTIIIMLKPRIGRTSR